MIRTATSLELAGLWVGGLRGSGRLRTIAEEALDEVDRPAVPTLVSNENASHQNKVKKKWERELMKEDDGTTELGKRWH